MSVRLPNGGTFAIATVYGSALTITGITNANPGVATSTAHGLANGDIIVPTSGWNRLSDRPVRVSGVTANTFNLEGIDTSNTTTYPAGSGAGTCKKASTFVQIPQILGTATEGGEQQFTTYQFLEDDFETRIPTKKSAKGLKLTIGDDPTLPGYIEMAKANEDRVQRVIKFSLPGGSFIYYNGYVTVDETPSTTQDEVMAVEGSISFKTATRYAS
jgi:hypothetical protein